MQRYQLVCTLVASSAGLALAQQRSEFPRPMIYSVNPVGNGSFVGAARTGSPFVRYDELLFQKCSEIGSRSARVLASWREVEKEPGQWDWSSLDREIQLCQKYAIEPVVLICNIPAWVSPTGEPAFNRPPKEAFAEQFEEFITRMAKRYAGKARYYEFWNEQNGCSWINEGCDNAHMAHTYLPWLRRTYRSIKAVDPRAKVSIGGLDDVDGWAPLFVKQCYELRKNEYNGERMWDAIATHPYDKHADDTVEVVTKKLQAIHDIAVAYGDKDIELWITEYGWNAGDMSIEAQTKGTTNFLELFVQPQFDYLPIAQQLAMADFEPVHLGYGLCDLNLQPRPAFAAFQRKARHDVVTPLETKHLVTADGDLRIGGTLLYASSEEQPETLMEIVNEQQEVLATREIAPYQYSLTFAGLPRDVPLLARIYSSWDGRKQPPVLRLPVMIPSKRLANGDFESLFRAGVPWGWSPVGQAICRDSGPIADQYRHAGKHTLMLILFDNAQEHVFDEKLEIPIRARKGERFKLKCSARYFAPEEVGPRYFLVSAELYDPTQRDRQPRNPGERVSDDWTNLEIELESPCDTPILCVTVVSQTLPKERYLFCIDSITLEPVGR